MLTDFITIHWLKVFPSRTRTKKRINQHASICRSSLSLVGGNSKSRNYHTTRTHKVMTTINYDNDNTEMKTYRTFPHTTDELYCKITKITLQQRVISESMPELEGTSTLRCITASRSGKCINVIKKTYNSKHHVLHIHCVLQLSAQ